MYTFYIFLQPSSMAKYLTFKNEMETYTFLLTERENIF